MSNQESPIHPSIGRIVLVRSSDPVVGGDELPGIVTKVWGPNCINVTVFRTHGGGDTAYGLSSVMYDSSENSGHYSSWRWMPYQLQQALAPQGSTA